MKSWLPTTLLLLYFANYTFAIQYIELDPWSVGELMTARTTSVIGIIALLVLTFQMGKTVLGLAQSRSSGEKKISEVDPRSSTETSTPLPTTIAPSRGLRYFLACTSS